jgi:DNA-binding transcriptional ArsR family regulator
MGLTRTDKYTSEQVDLAQLLKVLGHPARIAIVQSIIRADKCICGDLVTEIGLAQSTISQHLNELKNVGIIQGTIEGTSVCYCINAETWNKLKSSMNEFLNAVDTNPNCC